MPDAYVTNRAKMLMLSSFFMDTDSPASFKMALCLASTPPTADTNTLADLDEIAVGNGYNAGGAAIPRSSSGFDNLTEDDSGDRGLIQIQDVTWTASSGSIPSSGSGARYAVLTDDSGNVLCWWDFVTERVVSDAQDFVVKDCEIQIVSYS